MFIQLTLKGIPAPNPSMIKAMFVILALSLAAAAQCFADSPHMGAWKLNQAKSKLSPGMGGGAGTVTYSAEGDKIKVTVEGTDKDGKASHSVWVGKFDGKPYPAEGNIMYNMAAYTMVDDHTNNITATKDGKTVWTGTIKISADGKSRTVTIHGKDSDGKEMTTEAVYDKQ